MRILITGGTGFLGNNLVRALLKEKNDLRVAIRPTSDRRPLSGLDVELVVVDLNSSSSVAEAISDVDVVIHAAAIIQLGWGKLEASRHFNVGATATLAEACRRKKIRMIHVSTVDALGVATLDTVCNETDLDPPNPACSYVVSKREAESAIVLEMAKGLDAVIVNPGFMIGPYDWKPSSGEMMLAIAKQFLLFAPAGGFCVVDVRDVADGIVSSIEHGRAGQRYILGGDNMTYLDFWVLMAKVMNRRPPRRKLPDWLAATAGKTGDLVGWFSKSEPVVNSAATQMGQLYHWYTSEKAIRELGYQIGSVEDGVRDAWDWFQCNGYA